MKRSHTPDQEIVCKSPVKQMPSQTASLAIAPNMSLVEAQLPSQIASLTAVQKTNQLKLLNNTSSRVWLQIKR